jgi:hypothetical protein
MKTPPFPLYAWIFLWKKSGFSAACELIQLIYSFYSQKTGLQVNKREMNKIVGL